MLTMIDEYTRECLAIRVARRLGGYEVIEALADGTLAGLRYTTICLIGTLSVLASNVLLRPHAPCVLLPTWQRRLDWELILLAANADHTKSEKLNVHFVAPILSFDFRSYCGVGPRTI